MLKLENTLYKRDKKVTLFASKNNEQVEALKSVDC